MTGFPPGYVLREPAEADAEAAARLVNAAGDADGASRSLTADDVLEALRHYVIRVVEGPDGELVAYLDIFVDADRAFIDAAVDPAARGRGIGSALLEAAERLGGEALTGGEQHVRASIAAGNGGARALLESRGFSYVRSFFRMEGDLASTPEQAVWPKDLEVRLFQPGDERVLYELLNDAFRDHWEGDREQPFEQFETYAFDSEVFRPRATFLVFDGEEPAAGVLAARRFGMGWIGSLGVRPDWRKRGLGLALLRQSFAALRDGGETKVGLGVDAENTTGATRLYERAGMHVAARFDTYDKKLDR